MVNDFSPKIMINARPEHLAFLLTTQSDLKRAVMYVCVWQSLKGRRKAGFFSDIIGIRN